MKEALQSIEPQLSLSEPTEDLDATDFLREFVRPSVAALVFLCQNPRKFGRHRETDGLEMNACEVQRH